MPLVGLHASTPQAEGPPRESARALEPETDGEAAGVRVFEALWKAHHGAVLAYARRRVADDIAGEILVATFAVLWKRLDGAVGEPPDDPLPWLYAVARRHLANHRRKESRRIAALGQMADTASSTSEVVDLDPAGTAVERAAALAALRSMRDADRELLMLLAWEGLEPTQAARVLGVSEATLAVRLHRARRRLEWHLRMLRSDGQP